MKRKGVKKSRYAVKESWPVLLMCAPGLIYFIIFNYLPMFGIVLAFKNFNYTDGILRSPWAGFKNFKFLFATRDALQITRNTLFYNACFIIIGTVLSIGLALLLNEIAFKRMAKIYQTIAIMPNFLSWVAVGFIGFALLSVDPTGYLNTIREGMRLDPISWYMEVKYWPAILVISGLWKTVGFSSVVYLAALTGISNDYLEAALIDGANKWQMITKIMLPMIRSTIIILLIMAIGRIFYTDFGLFYQMSRDTGMLYSATLTIDYYVYNALKNMGNVSMSAAAGVYQSVIGFLLVLVTNYFVRRIDPDSAMF